MEISSKNENAIPPAELAEHRVSDPLNPLFAVGDAVAASRSDGSMQTFIITSVPLQNMTAANGEPAYRYKISSPLRHGLEYMLSQREMEERATLVESARSRRARARCE